MNVGVYDLGDVCDIVDNMITMAEKHREALRQEYDEVIYAEIHPDLYRKFASWGAIDYLEIAHFIKVKPKTGVA